MENAGVDGAAVAGFEAAGVATSGADGPSLGGRSVGAAVDGGVVGVPTSAGLAVDPQPTTSAATVIMVTIRERGEGKLSP